MFVYKRGLILIENAYDNEAWHMALPLKLRCHHLWWRSSVHEGKQPPILVTAADF